MLNSLAKGLLIRVRNYN